jgi:transforming growth factor-beta-induced protein
MTRIRLFAALLIALNTIGLDTAIADDCPVKTAAGKAVTGKRQENDLLATASRAGKFKTLINLVVAADLVGALQSDDMKSVLAPTDEAFAKLPAGTLESLLKPENKDKLRSILTYHVLAGKNALRTQTKTLNGAAVVLKHDNGSVRINDANLLESAISVSNGTIYIIDAVLMPPAPVAHETTPRRMSNTIPAVATKAGMFKTLLTALKAAELAEVFEGPGPFTVFAPTDEAFAKIPTDTLKSLLKPENRSTLVSVLKYHVVAGTVTAKDAVKAGEAKTLQGTRVKIDIVDGRVVINDAKTVKTDVAASNGVIHIIDTVLMPK